MNLNIFLLNNFIYVLDKDGKHDIYHLLSY